MKDMKKFFLLLGMAAVTFAGCQKNEMTGVDVDNTSGSSFDLVADIAQTRTVLDGLTVDWEEGDIIYMVTTDGTWGQSYSDDASAETVAEFTYSDGKFSTESTITDGTYTFRAMYTRADQKTWHRGAASSHSLAAAQTQDCTSPTAHIKENDVLVGTFDATTPTEIEEVTMKHIYTMMQVDVKNNTGAEIEISKFEMTAAGAAIAGVFNIEDFSTPAISSKTTSETIAVTLTNGTVASGESLPVYFVMAPLADYSGDITFKVTDADGNTYSRTVAMNAISFDAGKYNTTTYTISTADEVEAKSLPYEETFGESLGEFAIEGEVPSGLSYVWSYDATYGAKASAYANSTNYSSEAWLVSPVLNLKDVSTAYLSFDHAGNYFSSSDVITDEATVWARIVGDEWMQLTIENYFALDWNFVWSGNISLADFVGNNVQIAFLYKSTETKAGTWEIKNVKVDVKKEQKISFALTDFTAALGSDFTSPVLSGNETNVTYVSSDADVATVDANGNLTLYAEGSAEITATAEETDEYNSASASYVITVTPAGVSQKTLEITFSEYAAGTQYAENEEHILDDDLTIYTTQCHFTTQLRIYSSSTHNGYVTSSSLPGNIVSMSFNMGNKVDVLNVYGSNDDGVTWTLVGEVSTTTTSYVDYAISFEEYSFNCFKLDVAGSNQIRIKSMSVTYLLE